MNPQSLVKKFFGHDFTAICAKSRCYPAWTTNESKSQERSLSRLRRQFVRAGFRTHPLVPGCVLAAVSGDSRKRRQVAFPHSTLLKFNKQTIVEKLGALQEEGLMTPEQGSKILAIDAQFLRWFRDLSSTFRKWRKQRVATIRTRRSAYGVQTGLLRW